MNYNEVVKIGDACLLPLVPYKGFFHDIYSCEEPFEYEERKI